MVTASELPIDTSATANEMADAIFGEGVTVLSSSYTGAEHASGIFENGDTVAPGVTPSDTGVILSTGRAQDITNSSGDANTVSYTSTSNKTTGDSDLDDIAGAQTYDAAVLEATFVPDGETLTLQVTFSSEEYLEYVDSGFNDAVDIFVNGEQAELTVGDGNITINNINDESNSNLYLDNPASAEQYNTEMDGLTITLTLKAPVKPGEENTIKIAIADGGDSAYDSNLLIAGNSVQSALVANSDEVTIHGTAEKDVDVLSNDYSATGSKLIITELNGVPVNAGDSVTLPSGETVTLNSDGTLCFVGDGDEDKNTFSYKIEDDDGNSDVGYIELSTVPCFTAGTHIRTRQGWTRVEHLCVGDMVQTRFCGLQPVRWVGRTEVAGLGLNAPVRIAADMFGAHRATEVSPNHRIALSHPDADMWFGAPQVFVAAKHLIDGSAVSQITSGQLGAETIDGFDCAARAQIAQVLGAERMARYPSALPNLRRYEARLLLPRLAAAA